MKSLGAVRQPDDVFNPADTMVTLDASTVATGRDLPAGTHVIRVTALSTGDPAVQLGAYVNIGSTLAAIPSSGVTTGSSAVNHPIYGQGMFRIGGSTEMSVILRDGTGQVHVECWQY